MYTLEPRPGTTFIRAHLPPSAVEKPLPVVPVGELRRYLEPC